MFTLNNANISTYRMLADKSTRISIDTLELSGKDVSLLHELSKKGDTGVLFAETEELELVKKILLLIKSNPEKITQILNED